MPKIGLFPGSFDPFTKGHEGIIQKALSLFDEVIIGVGLNSSKTSYFPLDKRLKHIESLFHNESRVKVKTYEKLTVEYAKEIGAMHIIRGLRDSKDFSYEKPIAHMNQVLSQGIETVFFLTEQEDAAINSNIVREIHRNKGDISHFVTHSELLS